MKIDLFTFVSQIINFSLFVFLLYYFLFRKVVKAIDAREETIRSEFEKAEESKKAAEEQEAKYEALLLDLDEKKEELSSKAIEEVKQEKTHLLEEAQTEIDEKKKRWEERVNKEKKTFFDELKRKIGKEVYSTAEFVLKDLANVELQKLIYQKFINILQTLSSEKKQAIEEVYRGRKEKAVEVITVFKLGEEEEKAILQELTKIVQDTPKIKYRVDPNEPLGICLKLDSYLLHWSTKNYFEKLEATFEEVLKDKHD